MDLLTEKNKLSIIMGMNYLSINEVNNLTKNDIIQLTSIAGEPQSIHYNNQYFFDAEIVCINNILAIRVNGKTSGRNNTFIQGVIDDVTELLPVEVVLDEVNVSLSELKSAGNNSVISFGTDFTEISNGNASIKNFDATLTVLGKAIAKGNILVINENFGFKVNRILHNKIKQAHPLRSSGNLFKEENIKYKLYDFSRPDKVTFKCILNIKSIHTAIINNLKLVFPDLNNYEVITADQLTFKEYKEMMDNEFTHFILEQQGYAKQTRSGLTRDKKRVVIEPDNAQNRLPSDLIKKVEEFISMRNQNKILCSIHKSSKLSMINETSINELLLNSLRNGWKMLSDINFNFLESSDDINKIDIVPPNDMIIMAGLGDKDSRKCKIFIVYPYITIEPFIEFLN